MRRAATAILLVVIFASLNGRAFKAACIRSSYPNASGEFVDSYESNGLKNDFESPQKQKSKKGSKQKPPAGGVPGGVPGGLPGGVPEGVPDNGPPLPLSQTLPNLVRKDEEIEKDAIKRVVPVYPRREKAKYASDALHVEVVVDEQGDVIAAVPLSGHPLCGAAVEAAREWKFKPTLRAGKPVKVTGILVFRVAEGAEGAEGEQERVWQAELKSYRELIAKKTPDNKKLAMAMATLASAAIDAERFAEALPFFKDAEQQNRLPSDAKPYYAQLIVTKFEDDRYNATNADSDAAGEPLRKALDLYIQAYNDESQRKPVDGRLMYDIGSNIYYLLDRVDKSEEKEAWLKKMLDIPGLPEKRRAETHYSER